MSATPVHDASAVDASLHLLADTVLAGMVDGSMEPCLLHVAPDADVVGLGFKPLEGMHPTPLLLGFVAPLEWYALGVATAGWAYHTADRALGPAEAARRRRRTYTVTVLSRSGEVATRSCVEGDPELSDRLSDVGDELGGEQVDLLRLALGLDTPPPPCATSVFWAVEWLSAVLGHQRSALQTWDDVAVLHPAMQLLADAGDGRAAEELVEAATAFVKVCTWSRLRALVIDDRFEVPELHADDARWLDVGAFSRFVLSRCPPLAMLRRQVGEHLSPPVAERLATVLDDLGVPATAWPDHADEEAA